jgi:hypothetical protein
MESNLELSAIENNVVSLDEQRKLRLQRDVEETEGQVESIAEPRCEGGVCTLAWSPKKKAAAA